MLCWDIETGPLPEEQIAQFLPEFTPPPHPGEFDPAAVKYGNTKDEAKRAAILAEAEAKHRAAVAAYESTEAAARKSHLADFLDRAAISPVTGRVLAIGFAADSKFAVEDGGGDEATIIAKFWQKYQACRVGQRRMVGCNIHGFDLPFLVRRSWILGVEVPATVIKDDRWWDSIFVDLRNRWLLGQRWGDCDSKLDTMARALGCGEKNGDGADFARLWLGSADERKQAVEYLRNDLQMTAAVAVRLGVV